MKSKRHAQRIHAPLRATSRAALLTVFVAAVIGGASTTHAVHVNPSGTGQVLIYPYYTVRGFGKQPTEYFDTLFTVTNTTNKAKALKVRLLEGKAGAEVANFNLFLGPFDAWSAAVTRTAEGAALVSDDRSCVVPTNLFAQRANVEPTHPNHLTNTNYRDRDDGGGVTLDRTREGFIEVIEMGEIADADIAHLLARNAATGASAGCNAMAGLDGQLSPRVNPPGGGLYGKLDIINVTQGVDFSFEATALDDWSATEQYTASASLLPTLGGGGGAEKRPSNTHSSHNYFGDVFRADWGTGPRAADDAVSAALLRSSLMGEFNVLTETDSSTDWIVTFPTKRLYSQPGTGAARRPFASNFSNTVSPTLCSNGAGASDGFTSDLYSREEGVPGVAMTIGPPTRPPDPRNVDGACFVTTALNFGAIKLLDSSGSVVTRSLDRVGVASLLTTASGAPVAPTNRIGWASMNFNHALQSMAPVRTLRSRAVDSPALNAMHRGLPAIGIQLSDFNNSNAQQGRVARYGSSGSLRYRVLFQ